MKIRSTIARCSVFLFALLFCLLTAACGTNTPPETSAIHTTNVKRTDLAEYGNFVYCNGGRIYRFNRVTETFNTACMDPECAGDCPLDCIVNFFAGAYDGCVYFCAYQQFTHYTFLACQDIATGEVKVLKKLEDIEDSGINTTFIEDGYWYYQCVRLKPGGNAADPEDYEDYICRISLNGSTEEPVFKCEETEHLQIGGGGKIITVNEDRIYATDIESKEKKELFNATAQGYTTISNNFSYLDGRIYFTALSNQTQHVEYTGGERNMSFLLWADVKTGENGRLLEEPVARYCLTDHAVYYLPFKLRYFFVPEDYEEHPEDVKTFFVDETLHACDFNGENSREVYTNEKLSYDPFTVIDGVLYGWMQDYDEEAHWWNRQAFFGAIELETGRMIRPETSE